MTAMKPATLTILRDRQPPTLNVDEHIRHIVACALLETFGNVSEAAKLAGISRRTLHRYLLRWPDLAPTRPQTPEAREARHLQRYLAKLGIKTVPA